MKNCIGIADLLCAYADNELNESNVQLVEDHLTICENCSAILRVYREISITVSETNVPAPDALRIGVMNRIQSETIPREIDNKKQRRQYRYIFTRVAPVAACLVVGLLVWQFWGAMWGADNAAMPAAAPAPMAAPAAAPAAAPEVAVFSDDIAATPVPDSPMDAAGVFGLEDAEDEAAPVPGNRITQTDNAEIDFLEILYDSIDGFGPLDGEDVSLFRDASAVVTVTGELPLVLAHATPEPDWQYGRFGWEQVYVISRQMLASLIDEVGDREGTIVIYNHNEHDTVGAYIIILLTYGL